jgi:hypothetical protein
MTTPASESSSATLSTTNTTTVTFAQVSSGASGTVVLPKANAAASASLTFGASVPAGVAAPSTRSRMTIGGSDLSVLASMTLSVNESIAVLTTPAFTYTLASAPAGNFYVAFYDENDAAAGWNVILGPGTLSGNTISFAATQLTTPLTLAAGDTYVFALVASSSAAESPSPAIAYTGTKTINFEYGYAYGYPTPGATATAPPATLSYTVTSNVSIGASPYPTASPSATLFDEHVAESDAGTLSTTTYATDSWVGVASSSSPWLLQLYGTTQQEPSSDVEPVITTLYGTPQTSDQYPAQNGASWTNSPAAAIAYAYSDGDSGTRTVNADGSYVDNESLLAGGAGGTATLTENSDGSGSMVGPWYGGGIVNSMDFSAPIPSPSPATVDVSINYSTFAQNQYGFPATQTLGVPQWYALPLYTESDTATTIASFPSACASNALKLTNGTDVKRVITTVDTVVGYVETTTFNSYEYDGQPVCITSTDVVDYAYDEQNNTPYFIDVSGGSIEVVTTTESLVLQSASGVAVAASSRPATTSTASTMIAPAIESHLLGVFARARAQRTRELVKIMGGTR